MAILERLKQNYTLASLTTFKVGGPAEYYVEVRDKLELSEAYDWARANAKSIFVLGGASNILISDQGISGLVLKIKNEGIVPRSERLDCGAGANLNRAMYLAAGENLSGLEWSAGIPGATVGGAVRGNAGAFGMSMADIVETVEVFDQRQGIYKNFSAKDCQFGYRQSIFSAHPDFLIWQVILKLKKDQSDLIQERITKNLNWRRLKQPNLPSAGSIFKNLAWADLEKNNPKLAEKARVEIVAGDWVPAGWLIEQAGLKGKKIGDAKISLEHANFIVNTGKATAEDIWKLINLVKNTVKIEFGLVLEEEVKCLGFC